MQGKKSSKEKKRKHSRHEGGGGERKRRSTESSVEDAKEEVEVKEEAPQEPSDVEEGGLDLSIALKPISAYMSDRQEMLHQCFKVLGDDKLRKMLPDELKDCSLAEIKSLSWDQLQKLSQCHLLQILEGKELTTNPEAEENEPKRNSPETPQNNNVDSTSSMKETVEADDKQGGSGEESDVLSINADMDDSDIEGHKEEKPAQDEAPIANASPATASASVPPTEPALPAEPEPKLELQSDIDKSVSEILALTASPSHREDAELTDAVPTPASVPAATPSAQQLALLELEMRARAIKALMKANELKK